MGATPWRFKSSSPHKRQNSELTDEAHEHWPTEPRDAPFARPEPDEFASFLFHLPDLSSGREGIAGSRYGPRLSQALDLRLASRSLRVGATELEAPGKPNPLLKHCKVCKVKPWMTWKAS